MVDTPERASVNVSERWLVALAPAVFLLLWSGGYTVAKIGIGDADPFTLLAIRYASVLVVLLPFLLVIRPPLPQGRHAIVQLAVVGFLIQVVYFGAAWNAFRLGASAGTVALITSLQPVLVALVMPWVSAERVSLTRWAGLGLGLLGTALVLFGNDAVSLPALAGVSLSVAALVAFTVATVVEKRFGTVQHPLMANAAQYVIGLAGALPLAMWLEPMNVTWTPSLVGALAYLVLGNSILAISLLMMMLRRGEASRVSALFFLVPPVSAVIAWLLIDETMAPLAWLGMVIAAAGVWLATRRR